MSDEAERSAMRRVVASGRAAEVAKALVDTLDDRAVIAFMLSVNRPKDRAKNTDDAWIAWAAEMLVGSPPPQHHDANAVIVLGSRVGSFMPTWSVIRRSVEGRLRPSFGGPVWEDPPRGYGVAMCPCGHDRMSHIQPADPSSRGCNYVGCICLGFSAAERAPDEPRAQDDEQEQRPPG